MRSSESAIGPARHRCELCRSVECTNECGCECHRGPKALSEVKQETCTVAYRLPGGRTGAFGCHTFFCRLEAGHAGEHKDWSQRWHPEWEKYVE
jgi:hypothetical protein